MSERSQMRLRALALFAAPVTLGVAFFLHPYLTDETDISEFVDAAVADPDRWAWAHVMLTVGFGLMVLAALALRQLLRAAGEERWSFVAVPLILGGGTLLIGVWGGELDIAAVARTGGDVQAVFEAGQVWFDPLAIGGFVMLALGWISMALAVYRSKILGRQQTWVVVAATVVMLAGLLIPTTGGGYLFAAGMLGFTGMLGYHVLSSPAASDVADR